MDVLEYRWVASKCVALGIFLSTYVLLDATRHNPYLGQMFRAGAASFRSFFHGLFATLLILCLTIAPICAARCASTLCGASLPGQAADSCHNSTAAIEGASGLVYKSAGLPCTNTQLLFTVPRFQSFSTSLTSHVSVQAALLFLPSSHAIPLVSFAMLALPAASTPSSAPVPLRI